MDNEVKWCSRYALRKRGIASSARMKLEMSAAKATRVLGSHRKDIAVLGDNDGKNDTAYYPQDGMSYLVDDEVKWCSRYALLKRGIGSSAQGWRPAPPRWMTGESCGDIGHVRLLYETSCHVACLLGFSGAAHGLKLGDFK